MHYRYIGKVLAHGAPSSKRGVFIDIMQYLLFECDVSSCRIAKRAELMIVKYPLVAYLKSETSYERRT